MKNVNSIRSQYLSKILEVVFPDIDRTFSGMRWVNIILRTTHLIGIAGVGGGFLYHSPSESWMPYLGITVVSGVMMVGLSIWVNGMWLLQVRGVAVIVKLLFLGVAMTRGVEASIIIIVIIISGVIAHAPGKVRYQKVFRGPVF